MNHRTLGVLALSAVLANACWSRAQGEPVPAEHADPRRLEQSGRAQAAATAPAPTDGVTRPCAQPAATAAPQPQSAGTAHASTDDAPAGPGPGTARTAALGTAAPRTAGPGTAALATTGADGAATPPGAPGVGSAEAPIAGPRSIEVALQGSLEETLGRELGKELGTQLSQVTMRVLVWWLDVRKDFRRGDRLRIVYEPRPPEEPVVHAVWLDSSKLGKSLSAVRYRAEGQRFARWYTESGEELELRLADPPIELYEQVTSLLNDGRSHKGVDFKAPSGTPLYAPFDGVVVSRNWAPRNGNCLQLQDRTGLDAKLLHLDRIAQGIGVGVSVKRGQVIGYSGNTGRSTAPHLHYQLERNGRPVDPFRVHQTWRAKLPEPEIEKVRAALARHAQLRMGPS